MKLLSSGYVNHVQHRGFSVGAMCFKAPMDAAIDRMLFMAREQGTTWPMRISFWFEAMPEDEARSHFIKVLNSLRRYLQAHDCTYHYVWVPFRYIPHFPKNRDYSGTAFMLFLLKAGGGPSVSELNIEKKLLQSLSRTTGTKNPRDLLHISKATSGCAFCDESLDSYRKMGDLVSGNATLFL